VPFTRLLIIRLFKLRRMRLARKGDMKNAYTTLLGKPEETRPCGRIWYIGRVLKGILKEIGCDID
jgi:hypothetical protein